jgi:hypothetical protein
MRIDITPILLEGRKITDPSVTEADFERNLR